MYSGFPGIPCWEIKSSALLVRVYLSPSREIIGLMPSKVGLPGDLWSHHGLYWNFFLLGFLLFRLHSECRGPPWVESFGEEAMWVCWIHLRKYKHIPFPVRLVSQISIVSLTHLGTKWAGEEKCPSIPRNAFLPLLKYFPVVGLKNLKQTCINNNYEFRKYLMLESSKVCFR